MKQVLLTLMLLGTEIAFAASSYRVNLYRVTNVNGTEFKAGECKVELHENRLVLRQGKVIAEANVKVESNSQKFPSTTVGYAGEGSGNELQEIRLGGTQVKVIFEGKTTAVAGSR